MVSVCCCEGRDDAYDLFIVAKHAFEGLMRCSFEKLVENCIVGDVADAVEGESWKTRQYMRGEGDGGSV